MAFKDFMDNVDKDIEKTAEIYRDNQKVGDIASGGTGNIKIGDILKFKIKVTNNSGQDVTNLTLHDEINGYYEWVESVNSNSIKGTVQGSEKVKGIIIIQEEIIFQL